MRFFSFLLFTLFSTTLFCQQIDVKHYRFQIALSDENDNIQSHARLTIGFPVITKRFSLDLIQQKTNGKGMKVEDVSGKNVASFRQENDQLSIELSAATKAGTVDTFEIVYSGVPADGLVISKNKFGDRTFFSDNWPDRARHWIPCNDALRDKASVEFLVTAPAYYQVISNGILVDEKNMDNNTKLTHWREDVAIPTKIMVIGVARFAVQKIGEQHNIPVTAWVYPQNKDKGFYDYEPAAEMLRFFTGYIGPYPFKKLANVQSTTIFGGMENANAIFYDENSVNGKRTVEPTIAHEIAHQWFGDMATEKSFAHFWLSEGFATYLTTIYWEKKYGKEAADKRLLQDKEKIIAFNRANNKPVVDSVSDLMDLLNANSYQKGGWVLHMLRGEMGDSSFQKIIQEYYRQYKGSNADTRDFQKVAENISGKKLDLFFNQWLYQPGIPKIKAGWKMEGNQLKINIQQIGKTDFQFPLTIGYYSTDGKILSHKMQVTKSKETFAFPVNAKPSKLILDPFVELLFEGSISEVK
jgi:aminopeptidase N